MTPIAFDSNDNPIFDGDIVVDSDGFDHKITHGKHRDRYGLGYVYGYYVPDYCTKKPNQ